MDADVERALQLAQQGEDASAHAYVLSLAGAAVIHGRSIDAGSCLFERAVELCEVNDLAFHLPAAHAGPAHVYAKVDVDGRADLAAQVARRNL